MLKLSSPGMVKGKEVMVLLVSNADTYSYGILSPVLVLTRDIFWKIFSAEGKKQANRNSTLVFAFSRINPISYKQIHSFIKLISKFAKDEYTMTVMGSQSKHQPVTWPQRRDI